MNTKKKLSLLLWGGIFAVAMAFVESAVVVYLRAVYYPEGFAFPLQVFDTRIAVTELFREAATIVMMAAVSMLASKKALSRFALFLYLFAGWDIFYYIFLFCILSWPPSLLTWDLLFLIPVTWAGPVLAPLINSATMIILVLLIFSSMKKEAGFRFDWIEWSLLIAGSVITVAAYTRPYLAFLTGRFSVLEILSFSGVHEMMDFSRKFVPEGFPWLLFGSGELLFCCVIGRAWSRVRFIRPAEKPVSGG